MSDARMIEHWEEHQRGQFEIFPAMLTDPAGAFAAAGLHPIDIYYGTDERSQTTSEYVKSFRGLIELARDCDDDGAIVRTITQTPHGQIYIAMLEHIKPPACWALLESASMFSPATEEIELFGTWHIRGETLYGDQEWYTTFRETENGIEGEVRLDDAVTAIQDFAIDGPAVFGRVVLSGNIFIMTGTVESGLLRGQLDVREGIFARFEGARV